MPLPVPGFLAFGVGLLDGLKDDMRDTLIPAGGSNISHLCCEAQRAGCAAAGAGFAPPSVAPQGGRDHGCTFAGEFGDFYRAEAERTGIVLGEVKVVAALVPAHLLVLMVGWPVDLDADTEFRVPVVLVVNGGGDLPARRR